MNDELIVRPHVMKIQEFVDKYQPIGKFVRLAPAAAIIYMALSLVTDSFGAQNKDEGNISLLERTARNEAPTPYNTEPVKPYASLQPNEVNQYFKRIR